MEAAPSSVNDNGKCKKSDKTRRSWTVKEEEALVEALKAAVRKGLKSENGFRCGYLSFLEDELKKAIPGTNIRANPHINSKIHVWKKNHGSLISMLSKSGIGWNDTDKMIEASNEAWEDFVKSDSNARLMRNKSWPYFDEWCEIFGNDRATADYVETFSAAVHDILNMNNHTIPEIEVGLQDNFHEFEEAGESMSVSQTPVSNTSAGKKVNSKKRKIRNESEDDIVSVINNLVDVTKSTMSDLVKQLGNDEMACAMDNAFDALGKMTEITMEEKVLVAELLVDNPNKLRLFLRLPPEGRLILIRRLLQ